MAQNARPDAPKADARSELFFVYGTLRAGAAPTMLADWLGPLRRWPATLAGRLLDLGAYPGAVLTPGPGAVLAPSPGAVLAPGRAEATPPRIVGELVAVPRGRIAELDHYEGHDLADPCRSLFVRERAEATADDGARVACFVYVWAGGMLGPEVAGGDWLAARGEP